MTKIDYRKDENISVVTLCEEESFENQLKVSFMNAIE
jgi:hypothetical protein